MNNSINPTTRAFHRYFAELGAAMAGYAVLIIASRVLLSSEIGRQWNGGWQCALSLAPAIPLALVFLAVIRFLNGMDELARRIAVDSLAVAGGVTAMLAASYGLIESTVFPHVSAWWTFMMFMSSWLIAALVLKRRYQ
ncbi:hypothetical protein [Prosthecobacter sp.]|uniref:hypothetical protein n=1 Tax=Prosthecobacter sp. TaxID=1965333 RepID=UPI0024891CD8|nr:hypothetical protein [Prosthecobacter sp.]MDI1310625.1 hypothetical protein [Prosthecobacter sp.]